MSEVGAKLAGIASRFPWSEEQAEQWWQENEEDLIIAARAKDSSAI